MQGRRDGEALVAKAERLRQAAQDCSMAVQAARGRGEEHEAEAQERTAADYRVLAAGVERELRGLPPLPAAGVGGNAE